MKTLELEIVQGFFFYPHYAFRYIFVKLDFANSVAFFKALKKAINTHHISAISFAIVSSCPNCVSNCIGPKTLLSVG